MNLDGQQHEAQKSFAMQNQDDDAVHFAVVNCEEQYSIWLADQELPSD